MPDREPPKLRDGEVVKERFKVVSALGTGAFGAVYMVVDLTATSGRRYAMKTEDRFASAQILKMEIAVLKKLAEVSATHACRMIARGKTDKLNFVVMTLTSKSLQALRKMRPTKTFTIHTGLRLGKQCATGLEELHKAGFIHRDIKPGNFSIGRKDSGETRVVYILDFGLARAFRDKDGALRTPRESTGFRGTVRYAPLACHRKEELSRKDDLESWFYQQVELIAGQLPWHATNDKQAVWEAKMSARRNGTLFHHIPKEMKEILDYLDQLHYVDEPDYSLVGAVVDKICRRLALRPDEPFDWENLPDVD